MLYNKLSSKPVAYNTGGLWLQFFWGQDGLLLRVWTLSSNTKQRLKIKLSVKVLSWYCSVNWEISLVFLSQWCSLYLASVRSRGGFGQDGDEGKWRPEMLVGVLWSAGQPSTSQTVGLRVSVIPSLRNTFASDQMSVVDDHERWMSCVSAWGRSWVAVRGKETCFWRPLLDSFT